MKKLIRGISYILAVAIMLGLVQFSVFADDVTLAVNVDDFSSGTYFTDATAGKTLTVNYPAGTNKFNKIQNNGTNIDLWSQTNPLIVSLDIESAGQMTTFRYFTSQGLPLTEKYDCSKWETGEIHNLKIVFKMTSVADSKAAFTTDLYVDDCFAKTYTYTDKDTATFKFTELRLLMEYANDATNTYYKVHSLQISNETVAVSRPSIASANGFTVTNNEIGTYVGKTVGDLKKAYTNAKVYSAAGVEISDDETKLAPNMKVKVSNTYGVTKLTDTYTLKAATPLAVNVDNFSVANQYISDSTIDGNVLKAVPNTSSFNKILNVTQDISLAEQTNPLIVSMDVESSGDMASFRFFTAGSLQLNSKDIPCADWKAGEKHNIVLVFVMDGVDPTTKNITYTTKLYIDDSFYETYQFTTVKDINTYKFSELRFLTKYKSSATNKYYKVHSLKVTNGNENVTKPTYTAHNGFAVFENKIANWNGKTVSDIIGTNNAKVYNASGVEVTDSTTPLTADMVVKVSNRYDIVSITDTYTLADPSKVYLLKTHLARTTNYRFAHWGRVDQNNKPSDGALENGVINTGVVIPSEETENTSFFSMGLVASERIVFENPQTPIVVSMNVNPWATNTTVTDGSQNNIKAVGFFARDLGDKRYDRWAYTDMIPVSDLVQNEANNLTMVYYPNVVDNTDRAVLYLNGDYYSDKYITSDEIRLTSAANNDKQVRLVVDKVDANKTSTIGVTDIYVYELTGFNELSLAATNATVVGSTINGWYSYNDETFKKDLIYDAELDMKIANSSAVASGDSVTLSVDYTSIAAGLRKYSRVYTLDKAYGDLTTMQLTADDTSVTLSAVGDTYINDSERLDSVEISKKLLMLAFYKGDELVGFFCKDVGVKDTDKSLTETIPNDVDCAYGYLWTNGNSATPVCAAVNKDL